MIFTPRGPCPNCGIASAWSVTSDLFILILPDSDGRTQPNLEFELTCEDEKHNCGKTQILSGARNPSLSSVVMSSGALIRILMKAL